MKIGRITQLTMEPLQCSQGGVPFNKPHLDAAIAEIDRLRDRVAELEAERDRLREFVEDVIRYAGNTGDDYLAEKARAVLEERG